MATVTTSPPYIKGLIYKENFLHRYNGEEFKPCAVDNKTLIKLIQCMYNDKISAFLPLMVEKYVFTKKQTDRLISEFLCTKEFYSLFFDIEQTYYDYLSNKVLKKNYIKKAKKKFLRTFFYLINNLDEVYLCQEEKIGVLIKQLYEAFVKRIAVLSKEQENKNKVFEKIDDLSNSTLSTNCEENENLFACQDYSEHCTSKPNQKENTTSHENISRNKNFIKAVSSIVETPSYENKNIKDFISSEISQIKVIPIKCTNDHKNLIKKYENMHDLVSKLEYKVKKLKDKLSTYESMERRMTILEYKLKCLSSEKPLIKHSKKSKKKKIKQ